MGLLVCMVNIFNILPLQNVSEVSVSCLMALMGLNGSEITLDVAHPDFYWLVPLSENRQVFK